jgi:hypothetical protein
MASVVGSFFVVTAVMYVARSDHVSLVSIVDRHMFDMQGVCETPGAAVMGISFWSVLAVVCIFFARQRCKRRQQGLIDAADLAVVDEAPQGVKIIGK